MALEGIDYSYGPMSAATATANGLSFVARYVSTPGSSKNLTAHEVQDFLGAGVGIVVVFEQGASGALGGAAQGAADAKSAAAQACQLGLGACPIYFAVDFDATQAQLPTVADYFRGVAGVLGLPRTGIYGGYGHQRDQPSRPVQLQLAARLLRRSPASPNGQSESNEIARPVSGSKKYRRAGLTANVTRPPGRTPLPGSSRATPFGAPPRRMPSWADSSAAAAAPGALAAGVASTEK